MKNLLIIFALVFSTSIWAKSYQCDFEASGEDGVVKVKMSRTKADVNLTLGNKVHNYKSCKVDKDEFGSLVDCKSLDLDFMVLINEETGGIMSSTLDLFVDLEC